MSKPVQPETVYCCATCKPSTRPRTTGEEGMKCRDCGEPTVDPDSRRCRRCYRKHVKSHCQWNTELQSEQCPYTITHHRPIHYAKIPSNKMFGGVRVEEKYNFPGGSGFGFDGSEHPTDRRWPVVDVHIPLPCGRENLREELTERLQKTIDDFIKEKELDR